MPGDITAVYREILYGDILSLKVAIQERPCTVSDAIEWGQTADAIAFDNLSAEIARDLWHFLARTPLNEF